VSEVWESPPAREELTRGLSAGELHVWRARLEIPTSERLALEETLSEDERARVARFLFDPDRARFAVSRAFLRAVLGLYLGVAPAVPRFTYGEHGKPALEGAPAFNLSHSGGLALLAVTAARPAVGVDVEWYREVRPLEGVVERICSTDERDAFWRLPAEQRREVFFRIWSRKEAFVKISGAGFSMPVDVVEVSQEPEAALVRLDGSREKAGHWSMRALAPGESYSGCVAHEGPPLPLRLWQWSI
jgi:4'-phosphopantetheinyl transferase